MDEFLLLAFVFLAAGIVAVPIASRLGLGSVLGLLVAGIAISPILQTLGVDVVSIQHFAEFGVVMMLFLVGLELEPRLLWEMKARLLGLGGMQVAATAALVMVAAMLVGQPWSVALAIGLILALSSTAIVLQTLNEKGLIRSDGGRASFSVLLFQDIAVIPMLALLPLIALPQLAGVGAQGIDAAHDEAEAGLELVAGMAAAPRTAVTLAAIALVVVGGSLLTRPLFRFVSVARLRELFVATALLVVIGIALLMSLVGLSPALGTFLGGVVLANSEYRHELESDINPFRGLLLGLFFMTVGASIDFGLLWANLLPVLAMTLALVALKAAVLFALATAFGVPGADRWLVALGLAQAGEFGFVLISFTVANNVIPGAVAGQLLLVITLSMLLTPGLFVLYDRVVAPRFAATQAAEPDEINETGPVIIAGHGRWGGIVNRMLLAAGYKTVVLDHDSRKLEMLRTFGFRVFFGDATRPDLLHAAGIEQAKLLVIAIDDRAQTTELVRHAIRTYPNLHVIARAHDRSHVYELWGAGCRDIIRETFDSGVRAGRSAMEALGLHPFEAHQRARDFERRDRAALRSLAGVYDPDVPIHRNRAYVELSRRMRDEQEAEMRQGISDYSGRVDRAWSPPTLSDVEAEAETARQRISPRP